MNRVKNIMNMVHLIVGYFAILQLVALVVLISMQVFCRYVLGFSISWVEEVSLILVIWFSFIAMAIGVKNHLHISIELFTMFLPERIQHGVIAKIASLCIILIGIVMMYYGALLAENGLTSTLPATNWPSAVEYIIVPFVGFLITYDALMDLCGLDKGEDLLERQLFHGGEKHA